MSLGKLKVNFNEVEPIFKQEIIKPVKALRPEQVVHNNIVKGMYEQDYYAKLKAGAPLFIEPEIMYSLAGQRFHGAPAAPDNRRLFGVADGLANVHQREAAAQDIRNQIIQPPGIRDTHVFHVAGFNNTPWADWDWPSDAHHGKSVTVGNLNDIYGLLDEFTAKNNALARVYLTPKGAHAAILSHRMGPVEFNERGLFDQLNPDEYYKEIAIKGKDAPKRFMEQGFIQQPVFNVRVSPKKRPGDPVGDFVAYELGTIGSGRPHPENLRQVERYHDHAVARSLLHANYDPTVEASKVLGNQLAGLPSKFRDPIEQALDAYLSGNTIALKNY